MRADGYGMVFVGGSVVTTVTKREIKLSHPYPQLKAWAERRVVDRFEYKPIYQSQIDTESPVTSRLVDAIR